jgi:hypothetical protein
MATGGLPVKACHQPHCSQPIAPLALDGRIRPVIIKVVLLENYKFGGWHFDSPKAGSASCVTLQEEH